MVVRSQFIVESKAECSLNKFRFEWNSAILIWVKLSKFLMELSSSIYASFFYKQFTPYLHGQTMQLHTRKGKISGQKTVDTA